MDFGKHIIPRLIETRRVHAFRHEGYWEDIGTIRAFYEANLDLCEPMPQFNFYDASAPIFTHARYLPGHQDHQEPDRALDHRRRLHHQRCRTSSTRCSACGAGSRPGATIRDALIMGQDYYDSPERVPSPGRRPMGIGHGAWIERTIVDKNARIGDDVRITPEGKPRLPGRPQLLHPGRDRDHPQERGDPERHRDLTYISGIMSSPRETGVVFLSGVRTGFGAFGGALKDLSATDLGAIAWPAPRWTGPASSRPRSTTSSSATSSRPRPTPPYLARHIGLRAGLPIETPALTVNRLCGSGFEAVIQAGPADPAWASRAWCWPVAPSR